MNKSTQTGILVVMGLGLAATATFLFTRKAAAANQAAKAFIVDQDCGSFLVVDEAQAKGALVAAAIAVAPAPGAKALDAVKQILTYMFPLCDWNDPPANRTFVRANGDSIQWVDIENMIGDKTVTELKDLISSSGEMQAGAPPPWLVQNIFGTGGCLSCALGTGGKYKTAYRSKTPVYAIAIQEPVYVVGPQHLRGKRR